MNAGNDVVTPLRPRRPCPECGKPSARETYPFCSARCKDIDLNRWLKGVYVIPGRDDEEDEGVAGDAPNKPSDDAGN